MNWASVNGLKNLTGRYWWLILPLVFWVTCLILRYNGLFGQDSFEYLRYTRAFRSFFLTGNFPGTYRWPPLYPLSGAVLSLFMSDILALQMISVLSFALTGFFLERILKTIYPGTGSEKQGFLLLFFILSPFVIRYSLTIMSDPMAMFFVTASFYFFLKYEKLRNYRSFFWMNVLACCSACTRYAALVVLLVPVMIAWIIFFRKFNGKWFLLSLVTGVVLFLPDLFLRWKGFGEITNQVAWIKWSFLNWFRNDFQNIDGHFHYLLPNGIFSFANLVHPGYFFPGIVLIPLSFLFFIHKGHKGKTEDHEEAIPIRICWGMIVLYALFIAGISFQSERFELLTFPFVILVAYTGFFAISGRWQTIRKRVFYIPLAGILLVQLGLDYRAFRPFYADNRDTRIAVRSLEKYPGRKVYEFNLSMAFEAYGVKNPSQEMWSSRLDHFEPGALVVFNYEKNCRQWKGLNPMLNWETLNRDHSLKHLETLPGGWNIYEIGN